MVLRQCIWEAGTTMQVIAGPKHSEWRFPLQFSEQTIQYINWNVLCYFTVEMLRFFTRWFDWNVYSIISCSGLSFSSVVTIYTVNRHRHKHTVRLICANTTQRASGFGQTLMFGLLWPLIVFGEKTRATDNVRTRHDVYTLALSLEGRRAGHWG